MNKTFAQNLLSQGSIKQDYLLEKCKDSVFVMLIKISISVLKFSTELAKKPTIFDLLFLIVIYYPKNDNKHPSEKNN